MNSELSPSHGAGAATGWSVVLRLARERAPGLDAVLGELAQRYEYPVYAFLRASGHDPARALSCTRAMLQRELAAGTDSRAVATGHYRQFLLDRVRTFVQACGGDADADASAAAAAPLESDYQRDQLASYSPAHAFQRGFALIVLRRSLQRLRDEAAQAGHQPMYDALERYLAREPRSDQYAFLCAELHRRQRTLVLALRRLRQRFRELAAEELADTIVGPEDLAGEREALLDCLGKLLP